MTLRPRDALANTTLVTALIAERPTCLACIARRCALSEEAAETVLTVIQRVLALHREEARACAACAAVGTVFSVDRPAG